MLGACVAASTWRLWRHQHAVLLTVQALQEAAEAHQCQLAAANDAHEHELQVRSTPKP